MGNNKLSSLILAKEIPLLVVMDFSSHQISPIWVTYLAIFKVWWAIFHSLMGLIFKWISKVILSPQTPDSLIIISILTIKEITNFSNNMIMKMTMTKIMMQILINNLNIMMMKMMRIASFLLKKLLQLSIPTLPSDMKKQKGNLKIALFV